MSKKISKKTEQINAEVQVILDNALKGGDNKVARELTFAQGVSIRLRALQIIKENAALARNETNNQARQIDRCWDRKRPNV